MVAGIAQSQLAAPPALEAPLLDVEAPAAPAPAGGAEPQPPPPPDRRLRELGREEAGLLFGLATTAIFTAFGKRWLVLGLHESLVVWKAIGLFVWLFGATLTLAFGVVR
eukprot:SAG22_NODE_10626_length_524_cov_0.905882_1_plen_108_part_01